MKKFKQLLFVALLGVGTVASAQTYRASFQDGAGKWLKPAMLDDGTNGDKTANDGIYSVEGTTTQIHNLAVVWFVEKLQADASYKVVKQSFFLKEDPASQVVLFTFDTNTYNDGWMPETEIPIATDDATLYKTVQLNMDGEATADSPVMTDDDGDNIYTYDRVVATAGDHVWWSYINGKHWKMGIAANGKAEKNGGQINPWKVDGAFTTTEANQHVTFMVNIINGRIKAEVKSSSPYKASYQDGTGAFQKPFMVDDGTNGDVTAGDGIFSVNGTTTQQHGAANVWYIEKKQADGSYAIYKQSFYQKKDATSKTLLFTFDTNTYADGWLPATEIPDSNDDLALYTKTEMKYFDAAAAMVERKQLADDGANGDSVAGDNIYTVELNVAATGTYTWYGFINGNDWKMAIAANGKIEAYGGLTPWKVDGVFTTTADNQKVTIFVNIDNGRIKSVVGNGLALSNDLNGAKVSVFPNPSRGSVNVSFSSSYIGKVSLNVFTNDGKVLQSLELNKADFKFNHNLDLLKQKSGMFLIEIKAGDYTTVQRVIKL